VLPPDTNGDVGPQHYVQWVNLSFAVYDKSNGAILYGPADGSTLWSGFEVPDCTDPSGDPVVMYDQFMDRWILSQFTTAGPEYWNCVAVSTTSDPTGSYYRYAFSTGPNFPDYPKYGNWTDSYVITTREFGPTVEYGIGVYGLEKNKMVNGEPARSVRFFIDGNDPSLLPLVGDGLLPADVDGKQKPKTDSSIPIIGTQDDGAGYGGTFDALNIWDLNVKWRSTPIATLSLNTQLPTAVRLDLPVRALTSRDCLPPQRASRTCPVPTSRRTGSGRRSACLSRNPRPQTLATNQSVEATPGVAGVRWYEVRRVGGTYSLQQQGNFAPNDAPIAGAARAGQEGQHGLGYSVVNGRSVTRGSATPAGSQAIGPVR
jgi:hypothetical protein